VRDRGDVSRKDGKNVSRKGAKEEYALRGYFAFWDQAEQFLLIGEDVTPDPAAAAAAAAAARGLRI